MLSCWAQSSSKTLIILSVTFLFGIVGHSFFESSWFGSAYFSFISGFLLILAFAFRRRSVSRLLVLVLAVLIAAFWRYESALVGLPPLPNLPTSNTQFRGHLAKPVRQTIRGTVLTLDRVFFLIDESWQPLEGRFRVWISPPEKVPHGAEISWSCRVRPSDSEPKYFYYLESVVAECGIRGPPTVIGAVTRPSLMTRFRDRLRRQAANLWPEPESSFMLGLLLGDRDGIPYRMTEDFRETGTSHILAVSGYNISRVVGLVMLATAVLRLHRRKAALLAGLAVIGFAVLVGSQASVIRAALMGCFSLGAILFSRQSGGGGALWLTVALMLFVAPLALRHDLGFQLSFAAVWGLGAFGPKLADNLRFIPERVGLRQMAAETLAATLATIPFILFAFGRLPLIGPLVNLIVLPFIPLSMMLGALAILLGSLWQWLALPFAWAGFVLLRIVETVVEWSGGLGFWAIEAEVGMVVAVFLGVCLAVWAWAWARPQPIKKTK